MLDSFAGWRRKLPFVAVMAAVAVPLAVYAVVTTGSYRSEMSTYLKAAIAADAAAASAVACESSRAYVVSEDWRNDLAAAADSFGESVQSFSLLRGENDVAHYDLRLVGGGTVKRTMRVDPDHDCVEVARGHPFGESSAGDPVITVPLP